MMTWLFLLAFLERCQTILHRLLESLANIAKIDIGRDPLPPNAAKYHSQVLSFRLLNLTCAAIFRGRHVEAASCRFPECGRMPHLLFLWFCQNAE
jgi:hypothetical protein